MKKFSSTSTPARSLQNEALTLLIKKRAMFLHTAARVVRCRWLAEDIIQEAVLKVCENGVDNGVQQLSPYLFRMVHNLAIEHTRKQGREQRVICADANTDNVTAPCACPDERFEGCEALRHVMAALTELPERTRKVFENHRIEGVPQREIATQMNLSPTLINFMVKAAHVHCQDSLRQFETGEAAPQKEAAAKKPKKGKTVKTTLPLRP